MQHPLVKRFRRLPLRVYLASGALLFLIFYGLLFVMPQTIHFSYAAKSTCANRLTLLPSLQKTVNDDQFTLLHEGNVALGRFQLLSTKVCAKATQQLTDGPRPIIASAPFGGWLLRSHYRVGVPSLPTASTDTLKRAIPVSKKLAINLSTTDTVHSYSLIVDSKTAPCVATDKQLQCDLPALELAQDKDYTLQLSRRFEGGQPVQVLKTKITTLTATAITDGTVKPGETVYARPTSFSFTADKPLRSATLRLIQKTDSKTNPVTITTKVDGSTINGTIEKELDREKDYELTTTALEATDGSSLVDPYVVPFHLSGGPKVTGINIGKSGVGQSARVVVSFDQELSATQEIAKLVGINGGAAVISKSGNQVIYQLQNLPKCGAFTMTIAKGVLSKYDLASTASWSYASRVTCYSTSVYGYSVRGRPLIAYYFGNSGPTTMYVGAIHGNEASSSGLMKAWIDDLEANPSLLDGRRIAIVPTINPDGVAAGSRTNANGVNLSRNFPTANWVSDINDTDGYHKGGGGSAPLSEPEARALASLTSQLRPRLLLSFHAVGSLVVGDPGGYSAAYASRYASMTDYTDATGRSGTFDYDITGSYEDWTSANAGIPSMVIELGSYSYFSLPWHRAALRAMLS